MCVHVLSVVNTGTSIHSFSRFSVCAQYVPGSGEKGVNKTDENLGHGEVYMIGGGRATGRTTKKLNIKQELFT